MIHVLGVDPGTKALGVARTDGDLVTLTTRIGADDPVRRLYELDRAFWSEVRTHPPSPTVVIVEGYLLHGPGSISRIRAGEVGGMIRSASFRLGAHVVEIPPGVLKRFATGNGNADKDAMLAAALDHGAMISSPKAHDEADAFHLRRIGQTVYGGPDDRRRPLPYELDAVASITWPVVR